MRNYFLLAWASLMAVSCGQPSAKNEGAPAAMPAQDTVAVVVLRADTARRSLELPGELQPYLQTELFAKVQGYIREMKVDIGDRVRKGQTLAVLEAPEVGTQVAQSEAALAAALSKYMASKDRYQRLYQASQSESPGIVAPVDLVSSHGQMAADSAGYEAVRQQSRAYRQVSGYLYITAPYDGVVVARKSDAGALVGAGSMLLTVQDNSRLRLRISVPETYTSAVGARDLSFSVDAYPQQPFTGMLARKTETIDPATRTELWEYAVDNRQRLLKAGTFVIAKLQVGRSGASLMLPATAVVTTLERRFVIRVREGKAEWVDVRQGMVTDKGVEVFGALSAGDTIVVKGSDERKAGSLAVWRVGGK